MGVQLDVVYRGYEDVDFLFSMFLHINALSWQVYIMYEIIHDITLLSQLCMCRSSVDTVLGTQR